MADCLSDRQIREFLSEGVSGTFADEARQHLVECAHCQKKLESARLTWSTTSTVSNRPHASASDEGSGSNPMLDDLLPSIEGYDIISRIHSGAQGVVYKATQLSTRRTVAVKILPHEGAASSRQKQRFEREVGLAASLRHPHIVTVYDSGLTSGRYYFAMEYIHGSALDDFLARANLGVPEKMRLFATICSAVSYAHQKGVIHRDLKPGNILVDSAGQPHIVDFGLAKSAGVFNTSEQPNLTLTSQFMGTLAYASPEQTKGDPSLVDMRSDIYALGVILFEMLTGAAPYRGNPDLGQMFHTICTTPPRVPSTVNASLDKDIDTILLRTLAKEPDRRYQTVADLQADVERWLFGEPISARRDSLPYLMKVRGRRLVQRRRVTITTAVAAAAALAAIIITEIALTLWPAPINAFEHLAIQFGSPAQGGEALERVRLIAIDDATPDLIEQLAAQEQLEGVSAEEWTSVRRLHGRLMQRLAQAGAAAVVWDIVFPSAQSSDVDFIAGVKSLQAVGVNPVVAVKQWDIDATQPPRMSPAILESGVAWGGVTMGVDTLAPWRVDLVVQRGQFGGLVGLGLAAVATLKHPMTDFTAHINPDDETVQLRCFSSSGPAFLQSLTFAATEHIKLSAVRRCVSVTERDDEAGIRVGDLIGQYVFMLPTDEQWAKATVSYQDVFSASPEQLREWFHGKAVLIGDLRTGDDWYDTPDGRVLGGPHGHAAAIDALLRDSHSIRYLGARATLGVAAIASLFGLMLARVPLRRVLGRTIIVSAAVAIITTGCLLAFRSQGYLCDPLCPTLAMAFAFIGVVLIDRIHRVGSETDLQRRTTL